MMFEWSKLIFFSSNKPDDKVICRKYTHVNAVE